MTSTAKDFIKALEEKDIKYRQPREETNGKTVVPVGFNITGTSIQILNIFDENNTTMAMRIYEFQHVSREQYAKALVACNQLNTKKRWCKFVIDNDNDINIELDAQLPEGGGGQLCVSLLMRMAQIAEDGYAVIQKAIWS